MPRVLRIINRLNLGGPTYNASYLSKYLSSNYETMLVAGMHDETEASSEFITKTMGLDPVYVPDMYRAINPLKDRPAYKKLKKIIKEYKPDVVHTHAAKAGALGRMAARSCKVPVIVHTFHGHVFHSYFNPIKTRAFIQIERYLAGISTRIIAISNEQKRELGAVYNITSPNKIEVVPLGFDLARFQEDQPAKRKAFRKDFNLSEDELAVGIIGRLVPIKNHRLFIDAIAQVAQNTTKKMRAFIIGDGEEKGQLTEYCKTHGLTVATTGFEQQKAQVTFTSWIKNVDYALSGLDIVALTSLNEGTPVSLIEAQAANKPIVTTAVGGITDVVIPEETALLSPSDDVKAFANNLLSVLEDDQMRSNMGVKGHAFVNDRYHYMRLVNDTEQLYNRLLKDAN